MKLPIQPELMLVEQYVNALLRDTFLPGAVWELRNAAVITDDLVAWAWCMVANTARKLRL